MLKIPDDVTTTLSKVLIKSESLFEPVRTLKRPIRKCFFLFYCFFFILTLWSFTTSLRMNKQTLFNNFATKRTQCINNAFHNLSLPAFYREFHIIRD